MFHVGDTSDDGTIKPILFRKTRVFNPFPNSLISNSLGFRCRFAIPGAQDQAYLYMSGFPSIKIMRLDYRYQHPDDLNLPFLYPVDKFALNSNYLVIPHLAHGRVIAVSFGSGGLGGLLSETDMKFTGGITNVVNFAYTPESDYFLMQSLENKLFLYQFGSSTITFIRQFPATLSNSANLLYIKGTNFFVANDNGEAKLINVRLGTVIAPANNITPLNGFGITTIMQYKNPANQKTYVGFAQPNGMFNLVSTLLDGQTCVNALSCADQTSNCLSTWEGLNICRGCASGYRLLAGQCSQNACPDSFFSSNSLQLGNTCLPCYPGCRVCSGDAQNQCSSWYGGGSSGPVCQAT